ncbi:ABC-ATPase domain-containing protein [Lacicoccus qingdaonensis]|uniref:Predicted ATPase of the ABC class n=1 Tax=Lacicoccus qingdaonensis TaxID=576118 RepID=A0A1G9FIA9_9BACL|nr:ABC-ATPase domain-containing protein [Salinicoccus qingdaonensis]SDK88141.1 Predicted ATPase of the ABC class [Salinicoccus qingdaonensis]
MKDARQLESKLNNLDGQKYGAYKQLKGIYQFKDFRLAIDHVQVDPFAPPSKMRLIMNRETAGIPAALLDSKNKRIAVSDFLTRAFGESIRKQIKTSDMNNKNIKIMIDRPGQEILERTSTVIDEQVLEVRFEAGLPAAGRKILGRAAARIITGLLPEIAGDSLFYQNIDQKALREHVEMMLDQVHMRKELDERDLVAFVADESILPRHSGVSDKPLKNAVPFSSPENLKVEISLPSGRTVTGMGIGEGITLIVGGGYHGKSTLLQALERGVYNHIPDDGREMVITRNDASKIRAEDGRNIEKVNISTFINNLPAKKDTHAFSTENASGSTSQAANVMEALEADTRLLLIDEDTSATNFMIRDARMQKLIAPDKEPITPFSGKVKPLYEDKDVSTILIVGGSGDYFDVADRVLMMDEYKLKDVTAAAKEIAETEGYRREDMSDNTFGEMTERVLLKSGFPKSGKESRLKTKGRTTILYGREPIEISGLEQLVDDSQTNCISVMIEYFRNQILDDRLTMSETADRIYNDIEKNGLDSISPYSGHPGNLALPRKQEFIGTLNRYRSLKVK